MNPLHCPDCKVLSDEIDRLKAVLALVPTWKDAPDCAGLWVWRATMFGSTVSNFVEVNKNMEARRMNETFSADMNRFKDGRWFGPMPSEENK